MSEKTTPEPQEARFDPLKLRRAAELKWADPTRAWGSLAEELDVNPKTLYRWRQSEEWEVIFRQAGQEYMEALAPTAILALRKAWNRGNPAGALEILRNFGLLGNERIEIDRPVTIDEIIAIRDRVADPAE